MAINKTTEEMRNKIRRNTVIAMPDRPSERGIRASDIKDALSKPICGDENSVLAELDRVVDEVNENISGIVPMTRKINGHSLSEDVVITAADLGLSTAYKYKGSVATYGDLPSSNLSAGDVYNVVAAYDVYPAGTNYAWDGTQWDALGGEFDASNLQVKTGWAQDSSATSVDYTIEHNKTKSFTASGITSVKLTIPSGITMGFMAMICVKHGSTAPAYTFVNNSGKPITFVQFGAVVPEYVPTPNALVRFLPSCVDGETIEMLVVELANE